ncbi:hypothetical protein TVAG_152040 [Trichomonas vaginalis G3]|uniref:Uncharacterized protein n=2 Tax=Trichomonas vaginalis (strain ATCC PRA-98 / G3) TaxID=412133 RepID=A2ELW9_TRIV3|nr:hypothetical protein TVAGG3_0399640 [Trichomonas vaginalis G3]EAY06397.1 hypothetical protein TVAG_152040 [Trichomonas vaginalis G3]KAI5534594.1 hypothetical protein TVAGG3_0399640 [Trichomonas vaginalis G3]|eukprot:XP_001318620.1 hypothetical protein [Trichomonas vaginalis G3]
MIYEGDYQPPFLYLDEVLPDQEADITEDIPITGVFAYIIPGDRVEAYWQFIDSEGKVVKQESLGEFTVSIEQMFMDFDIKIKPPTKLGQYILRINAYAEGTDSLVYVDYPFTAVPANYRPKLYVLPPEYVYYISDSEVSFLASAYDEDLGDKQLTAKVFFNNEEVATQEIANSKELKTIKFKVPSNTAAGQYQVKVTITDGKKIATKRFIIVIQDNTVLTTAFEPLINKTYNKGDKLNFTAVINAQIQTLITNSVFHSSIMIKLRRQ